MSIQTLVDLFNAETRTMPHHGQRVDCAILGNKLNVVLITHHDDGYYSVDPTLAWSYHLEAATLEETLVYIEELTGAKPTKAQ